jgi:hypothetical protein
LDGQLVLATDQSRDSFVRTALGSHASARLLYQRCREAHEEALPGQDYARLAVAEGGERICFCVCDGVGSSYRGDFAARFLADHVIAWLCDLAPVPLEMEQLDRLAMRLRERLVRWAEEAQETLMAEALPNGGTGIVGEVLQELRAEYGGETVFLAGRLDVIQRAEGRADTASAPMQAVFCSLGNVAGRVLADGAWMDLPTAHDSNRWSSARSLRGHLRLWNLAPERLDRLIVYTDGAQNLGHHVASAGDAELRERAASLLATPTSDDLTILDIAWLPKEQGSGEAGGGRSHG